MLQFFNRCFKGRSAWFLIGLSGIILELIALYFQHIMLMQPCVMCIYERCVLLGIIVASLIGALFPNSPLRYVAIFLWLYSAGKGIQLTWQHIMQQLFPSPFSRCDFFVDFPTWLPLDKWLPSIFVAQGDCSLQQWQFMSFSMPQWLLAIFSTYLLIGILVLMSQWIKPKRPYLFKR
ncbi:disulfide bond formation protein DsbB [Candidatus Fukatsuia symbiotica]|uniref:Disulfide bond formation protein B n=1 Tax=Candidatus Fukatsuia symbiotica TaxID=1878942 RepID=A0A2U8I7W7_9GAMM|nr:disulfide bond formation protein DsbB [Candidatus Fukatsuia symbiotica]AWK15281.1 disulfide bond formation protein B [Candidatus Fukatsuia symbiotica]MEA9444249.1 disulfide bond formation protein DsbB [Candidatus Fukatsuia symbiotica]